MTLSASLATLELTTSGLIEMPEVKTAHRRLQKIWHPDLHIGKETLLAAHEKAVSINNAYELITEHIELHGPIRNVVSKETFQPENKATYPPKHRWNDRQFTPGFPDETVFEVFVKSSNLLSIGYNPNTKKLYVKFQNNSVYEYTDVPDYVFYRFLNAESHGKFAYAEIYNGFAYRCCTEPNHSYKGPTIGKSAKLYLT
jgi:hypothetical protein